MQLAIIDRHQSSSNQVSSSCTSIYVDGSESRGALSAGFEVEYGSLHGSTAVTVWMPEIPIKVDLEDTRLSQIKGWKVQSARGAGAASSGNKNK